MNAERIESATFDHIIGSKIDVVLAASGYESRARTMIERVAKNALLGRAQLYGWGFAEHQTNLVRQDNDRTFRGLGFSMSLLDGNALREAEKAFTKIIDVCPSSQPTILVDISSMTRTWYGGIVKALHNGKYEAARIIFYYSPSQWSESHNVFFPTEIAAPMAGFSSCALPNKPAALVLGLGVERDKALGLNEHLDPSITMCFFANPGADPRFDRAVLQNNRELLKDLDKSSQVAFNLYDAQGTYSALSSVCRGLLKDYRVVVAALGPKIFGLYCFLLHTRFPEISVWRISSSIIKAPFDHTTAGEPVIVETIWRKRRLA